MTLLILALVFVSVTLAVAGLGLLLSRSAPGRRLGAAAVETAPVALRREQPMGTEPDAEMRRRLSAAGFASASAASTFRLIRLGSALALGGAALAALLLVPNALVPLQQVLMAACAGGLGWMWPPLLLDGLAGRRVEALRHGFPDSLDLMQVCVEAGLGLDAAIALVASEIGKAHPLLGEHYALLARELRAGRGRGEALHGMAERMGLDETKAFATMMIQSDALGTSIADALRTYAEDMRARRMLAAEEKAQQLGVKMSVPLVLLIMPALMVVIVTPAAQKMVRMMMPLIDKTY